MKTHFNVLILLLASVSSYAFPVVRPSLPELIRKSTCIVIARVENPNITTKYCDPATGDTISIIHVTGGRSANLQISKVLKGKRRHPGIVKVTYENITCPSPPKYPDQTLVLAFLRKDRGKKTFHTVGLSYVWHQAHRR